jgi:hypothetical protein
MMNVLQLAGRHRGGLQEKVASATNVPIEDYTPKAIDRALGNEVKAAGAAVGHSFHAVSDVSPSVLEQLFRL